MAVPSESNSLLSQFEEAYKETMATLTQEDHLFDRSPETLHHELQDKVLHFTDLARQLEAFFSQKRFLLYNQKPELILREDSTELKQELQRKDELIRRHYEKLGQWQVLLQDMQGNGAASGGETGVQGGAGKPLLGAAKPDDPPSGAIVAPLQPGAALQPGVGAPQGGFLPGNNYRTNLAGSPVPGSASIMHGPLAYLERTTSSVGVSNTR